MRDLKHLIYFENLLQEANNELVQQAKAEGEHALGYTCYFVPETLLNLPGCFSSRLRAPNTGSIDVGTYYMSSKICSYTRSILERGIEALPIFGGPVTMNRCDDMAVPAAAVAHKDADTGLDRDFPCIRQQPQRPFDDPPRLSVFPHDCTGGIKRFIPSETVQLRRQRTAEHIDFTVDIFRHFHLTVTDKTGFFMLLLYPCCAGMSIPRNKKSGHIRLQTFRRDDRLVDYAKAGCEKGKFFEGRFFFGVRSRLPSSGKCCNSVSGVVIFRSISRTI